MPQGKRANRNASDKHLASINFPVELLESLDSLATSLDMNRSSLVCLILQDFVESGKTIKFQVVSPG